jgi:hypothetical protein
MEAEAPRKKNKHDMEKKKKKTRWTAAQYMQPRDARGAALVRRTALSGIQAPIQWDLLYADSRGARKLRLLHDRSYVSAH